MVIYHLTGDSNYVIPELAKRSLRDDRFDIDPDEAYYMVETNRRVSVEDFATSELAHSRYSQPNDGPEISWVEANDEQLNTIIDDFSEHVEQLILLQVSAIESGDECTVSMLVNDYDLGYVEVMEIWKGSSTMGLIQEENASG